MDYVFSVMYHADFSAQNELMSLFQILEDDPSFVIIENTEEISDDDIPPDPKPGEVIKVRGSLVSFIDRLDDELTKSLQNIDPHTPEYIERLRDEQSLYAVITRGGIWFERVEKEGYDTGGSASRIVLRRLEHIYYKVTSLSIHLIQPTSLIENLEKVTWDTVPANLDSSIAPRSTAPSDLVQVLCVYLYKHGQPMLRTRAMLYHIYNFALQNQFHRARDMLLTSHLQETIHQADIGTQICYNRAMVQLGMSAFRLGMIVDAQVCLQEICGQQRQKELLAQGVQLARYSQQQVTPEQEKLERQRQLPFHMHINLELLECIYLLCSMLMEIPSIAQAGTSPDAKKRVISKIFRRFLEYNERQVFIGPPENTRDHVMQAAKLLSQGDWKKARSLVEKIKVWDLMGKDESERIKAMLGRKIQEEGVRTYLFTYSVFYDTLSLSSLAEMFDLSITEVSQLVTMMISNDEIQGQLDHSDENLIFQRIETTKLQGLALALSEKAGALVEQNQKVMEQRINAANVGQGVNLDTTRKTTTKREGKDRERFTQGGNKDKRRGGADGTEGGERHRRPKQVRIVG
jgi:translation initiation factor 3 subunit C